MKATKFLLTIASKPFVCLTNALTNQWQNFLSECWTNEREAISALRTAISKG